MRRRILLVEDNPDEAHLTSRALESLGVDVSIAEDGWQAIAAITDGPPPALVLLDLKLPGMNGLDLLEALRAMPEAKNIPIVVLTSSNEEDDLLRSYALGANSYVQKPVKYEEFIRVAKHLGEYWLNINQVPRNQRAT